MITLLCRQDERCRMTKKRDGRVRRTWTETRTHRGETETEKDREKRERERNNSGPKTANRREERRGGMERGGCLCVYLGIQVVLCSQVLLPMWWWCCVCACLRVSVFDFTGVRLCMRLCLCLSVLLREWAFVCTCACECRYRCSCACSDVYVYFSHVRQGEIAWWQFVYAVENVEKQCQP